VSLDWVLWDVQELLSRIDLGTAGFGRGRQGADRGEALGLRGSSRD
jgi:hypothetical protein